MFAQQLREKQPVIRNPQPHIPSNSPTFVNNFPSPYQSTGQDSLIGGSGTGGAQSYLYTSISPGLTKTATAAMPLQMNESTSSPHTGMETPATGYTMENNSFNESLSTHSAGLGSGLGFVGSPLQAANTALASPIFSPSSVTTTPSAKANKRARTNSITPNIAATGTNGSKGPSVNAANGTAQGRNRRGSGRRDSTTAKRKASITGTELEVLSEPTVAPYEPATLTTLGQASGGLMIPTRSLVMSATVPYPLPKPLNGNAQPNSLNKDQSNNFAHSYHNEIPPIPATLNSSVDSASYSSALPHQQAPIMAGQSSQYLGPQDNSASGPGGWQ